MWFCTHKQNHRYSRKYFSMEGVKARVLAEQEQPSHSSNLLLDERGWEVNNMTTRFNTDDSLAYIKILGLLLCHVIPAVYTCVCVSYCTELKYPVCTPWKSRHHPWKCSRFVVMSMKGTPGLSPMLESVKFAPRNYFVAHSDRAANSMEIENDLQFQVFEDLLYHCWHTELDTTK